MSTTTLPTATEPAIVGHRLGLRHPDGTPGLDDVSLAVERGTMTAIVGPSGAGKSTLLEVLAGVRAPTSGSVQVGGRARIGFVPQDDILHGALPLRRTLRHGAGLRLPCSASPSQAEVAVDRVLDVLGLGHRADVPVGQLSGGERKRAAIASEVLTEPPLCLLDEPTSGLDPASAADLLDHLAGLVRAGSTVVLTTHGVADLAWCDRVVVVAPGGRLAACGSPEAVLADLGAPSFLELHRRLAADGGSGSRPPAPAGPRRCPAPPRPAQPDAGWVRQWRVLTRRATELVVHDRLTLAILLGSPALVTGMMATLFGPAPAGRDPGRLGLVGFWLAFAAFFFGLTAGLLQVCTEVPILRRERHVGVRTSAYLASKVALLVPFVVGVVAAMVGVLQVTDRLPELPASRLAALVGSMALLGAVALLLGLAASAAVATPAQAALALPMLCFPAVLFGGSVVPVDLMSGLGRATAAVVPTRWGFEAVADHLGATLVGGSAGVGAGVLVLSGAVLALAARLAVGWRAAGT